MSKKLKSEQNKTDIYITLGISIFSLILWDSSIIYPIKIFVVLLHEISHAIAAIVSGGSVESISLDLNLAGNTVTKGGNQILIALSGYLGSLIFGLLIFVSAGSKNIRKWTTTILAIIFLLVAVNFLQGGLNIFLTLIIALLFYFLPRFANENLLKFFLLFIGLTSCFYIIADIKQDLLTTTLRETDTQIIEYLTGIPALAVGFFLFLLSILLVGFLIKKIFVKSIG
jgi:hypothetical protein